MKLGDFLKKFYRKRDDVSGRKLPGEVYGETDGEQIEGGYKKKEAEILEKQREGRLFAVQRLFRDSKFVAIGTIIVAVLVFIVLAIFGYFKFLGTAFDEEKIKITINGPDRIENAEKGSYLIKVENANRVGAKNSRIELNFPEEMVIESKPFIEEQGYNNARIIIGEIDAFSEKEFEITFRAFGSRDRQVYVRSTLVYQPENFNNDFEKTVQQDVTIKSSPLTLSLVPTKQATRGETVDLDVFIKNGGDKEYTNLELRMDYPEGFIFERSDVHATRDDYVWEIEKISPGEQLKIKIKGALDGPSNSHKNFKAKIGESRDGGNLLVYADDEGVIRIVGDRVELIQEMVEREIYAGDVVQYRIRFRNTSDVPLRDLILRDYISSRALDKKEVEVENGFYDSANDVIVWKAAQVPKLKILQPGEEGVVYFTAKVVDEFPMKNENDKNFAVRSWLEIESLDIDSPIYQNKKVRSAEKEVRINSRLTLAAVISYDDAEIPNEGPVPLVAEEKTTLTVRFYIANSSNDLKNVTLKTGLAPGVRWRNVYVPEEETGIAYNERTNEMKWVMGRVDAGVGFIDQVKTLAFQIEITPSKNQIKKKAELLNEIVVTGLDSYTDNDVEYRFKALSSKDATDLGGGVVLEGNGTITEVEGEENEGASTQE